MTVSKPRNWANEIADKYESGEWGWTQGTLCEWDESGKACYCLSGAIRAYAGAVFVRCTCGQCPYYGDMVQTGAQEFEARTLIKELGASLPYTGAVYGSVIEFNDDHVTTVHDVINRLREFANGE